MTTFYTYPQPTPIWTADSTACWPCRDVATPQISCVVAIARDREHLFVFITDRDVPATNNVCERALRPSVIFRK